MRSALHCKNMLTLRLDFANVIFSPRKCIVCVSRIRCGQCDSGHCDNKHIATPNSQTHKNTIK